MSDSLALTASMLRDHTNLFRTYERLVELELTGRSDGEIHELTFSRVLKPDPRHLFADGGVLMLGTDQRDLLVPTLADQLRALRPGGLVLDVGSGDGQTTALALIDRDQPLALIPLDPIEAYLESYRELFSSKFPRISIPRVLNAGMDELAEGDSAGTPLLAERVDAVLLIHSLYFAADPAGFLGIALDRLVPGGGS